MTKTKNQKMVTFFIWLSVVAGVLTIAGLAGYRIYSGKAAQEREDSAIKKRESIDKNVSDTREKVLDQIEKGDSQIIDKIDLTNKEIKSMKKKSKPDIKVENSPNTIIQLNEEGDNIINQKVEIPNPSLSFSSFEFFNILVQKNSPNIDKFVHQIPENGLFKTVAIFNYSSEIPRSSIDFLVNHQSTHSVFAKWNEGITDYQKRIQNGKTTGIRINNPKNGSYSLIIYSTAQLNDFWPGVNIRIDDKDLNTLKRE